MLDYVTPYVNSTIAFGEPISHRQSVAFMVANIGIELEGMRLVTYRAGSRAEQGLSFARAVALARRLCTDKGMQIGTDGVQLLGGHGFVKEHPVYLQRLVGEIARMAASLGGVDAVVFTGGAGEHSAPVRAAVCRRFDWLGIVLDSPTQAVA